MYTRKDYICEIILLYVIKMTFELYRLSEVFSCFISITHRFANFIFNATNIEIFNSLH